MPHSDKTLVENVVGAAQDAQLADAAPEVAYADPGRIAALVRRALGAAGLGQHDAERPFSDVVEPGMSVLLKPNWVIHRNRSGRGMECLVTNNRVILETLREVCAARPGRVVIGDAPIQSGNFQALANPAFCAEAQSICDGAGVQLAIVDFRRTVANAGDVAHGVRDELRERDHYVLFDLARDSLLEPLSDEQGRFRVTDYDPRELKQTHCPGRHQYLLCREPFDVDVVVNLPKLKTHSKAGLTAALKNLVGVNGNKDYLPHHRVGGAAAGGDCYPGQSFWRRCVELCYDRANMHIGHRRYHLWRGLGRIQAKFFPSKGEFTYEGAWHGNDTVWRMVLDLNRLLLYGRADGSLADTPQRRILSITDAVVAGEGNGPLASTPRGLGMITCAASSAFADLTHAALMCFDGLRIPLIRESFGRYRYPLVEQPAETARLRVDQQEMPLAEARARFGRPFLPAAGWISHLSPEYAADHRHTA